MVTLFPSFAYLAWYTWYTSSSIPLGCYISLQFFVKGFFQPSTGRKISSGVSQNVRREYIYSIYTLGKTCNLRAMFPFVDPWSLRNGAGYHWHLHFAKSLRYLKLKHQDRIRTLLWSRQMYRLFLQVSNMFFLVLPCVLEGFYSNLTKCFTPIWQLFSLCTA